MNSLTTFIIALIVLVIVLVINRRSKRYFISYFFQCDTGHGFGNIEFELKHGIRKQDDINQVQEKIIEYHGCADATVIVLNYIKKR